MRVALIRDGFAKRLSAIEPTTLSWNWPSEEQFTEKVNDFWYHAVWTMKNLRRGEVLTAKACCDGYMRRFLLKAI